ncbi:MAG: Asp-tRNA(Asn)/Glu-tRNA(Gln) amidotransferase subunit GatA [Myxococcota bacterium]
MIDSIDALNAAFDRRERTATDALNAALAKIEAAERLGAFLCLDVPRAKAAARAADERMAQKRRLGPLDGVPISLKDNLVTEGVPTTAGSLILEGWTPPYDGAVSARLKAAGAVIIGKTNMDEFGMGSSTERSAYQLTRNPIDETRVAGGSSGGSAVSVAADLVFGSYGTDTGGSIRQPAALTGIWGLKPTYGRVSRHGVIAYASSLDQVGPLGRSPADLAHLLQAVAGFDPRDSTSADVPVPSYSAALSAGVRGLKIGLPSEYFEAPGLDPEVKAAVERTAQRFIDAGATLVPISLPHTKLALSTYYVIAAAEASSNLARYDGVRYGTRVDDRELGRMIVKSRSAGFGPEVQRRIVLGTYVLSAGYYDAYYGRAQRVRTLIRQDFVRAFESVDLIATPTSPFPAFKIGSRLDDPLAMYLADVLTLPVSLAGVPALSAPAGKTQGGLPIGLQLIGPWFEEGRILAAGAAILA